ncbi:MAG: hypothetical protein WC881_06040 [Elusimicrobiota bacterium]|jgi:hypothetical protein
METLFRIFSRQTLILLIALALAWLMAQSLLPYLRLWRQMQYAPQAGQPAGGLEIAASNEQLAATRVLHRYNRVMAVLDQARSQGLPVAGLQNQAQAALKLNTPRNRDRAVKLLVEVEMRVPHKKTRYRPAPAASDELDIPSARPVRTTSTQRRRR